MKGKRLILLITFALATTLLAGCVAKKNKDKNPWDEKPTLQKETVSYKKELAFNDGQVVSWFIYEYDSSGNEIYVTEYSEYEGEIYSKSCVKEYDANGNVLLETYFEDGEKGNYYEHEYDENGNEISFDCYDKNGWSTGYVMEYNDHNLCIKKQNHVADGEEKKASFFTEYFYDDNGNLIKEVDYDSDGKETSVKIYSLNEEGKPYYAEVKSSKDNDNISRYYYTYDHMGNVVNETRCFEDKSISNIYEYDSQGRMIKYIQSASTSDGSGYTISEYSYYEVK